MTEPSEIPGAPKQVTWCKFTNILNFKNTLAELPIVGLSFSKTVNTSGPWHGVLPVEDERVRGTNWVNATEENKTAIWIDLGGALLYGGIVSQNNYTMSTGTADLSGMDFCGYMAQRLQARDYTEYLDPDGHAWATTGASSIRISYWLLKQAFEKAYSIPLKVVANGEAPEHLWVPFSAPEEQHQSLGSLISQMQELGYTVGVDYACDVAYDENGYPGATITLTYPRRGSTTPHVIDLSEATDLQYNGDGTQQADYIVEQAGATVVRSSAGVWLPARLAGYPLLEATESHSALAPTASSASALLVAYAEGDLAIRAYPQVVPVVTLPLYGVLSITDIEVGDDCILRVDKTAGDGPPINPRFPDGLEFRFRIVRIDVTIPDEGLPTMAITLNIPPSLSPVGPPEVKGGESGEEKESLKEREKEKLEEEEQKKKEEEEEAVKKAEEAEAKAKEAEEEAAASKKKAEEAEAEAIAKGELARAERIHREAEEAQHLKEKAAEAKRKAKEAKEAKNRRLAEKARRRSEETKARTERNKEQIAAEIETNKRIETSGGVSIEIDPANPHGELKTGTEVEPSATKDAFVLLTVYSGSKAAHAIDVKVGASTVFEETLQAFTQLTIPFFVPKGKKFKIEGETATHYYITFL